LRANALLTSFNIVYVQSGVRMIKWEYKVVPIKTQIHSDHFQADRKPIIEDVQKDLNSMGNEGWELVTVQDINLPDGRMFTVAYLKRQTVQE
jgi:hypothetical protein